MRQALRFQVLSLPNAPWPDLKQRFVRLEELGIEVAALADHFVDWTNPPSPWFESWTALTGLAAATKSIRLAEYVEIVDRLLRDEVTSFTGQFYRVEGAYMNPRPVQSPRPPILVGALGPVMMRHAARHADIWNSLSFHASFEDQLDETRRRAELMVEYCAVLGREPGTLRRSYTMFDAAARPRGGSIDYYDSVDRFEEMVNRVLDLGMDEVGLYYPLDARQVPTFERIATNLLPRLRRVGRSPEEP